ncbi:potassium-transporting ATPase subunit KdpA [Escherichia coli]
MLGTNGGGFFDASSSHPFENPTALTNFVQMLAIFLIPTALFSPSSKCGRSPPGTHLAVGDGDDFCHRRRCGDEDRSSG